MKIKYIKFFPCILASLSLCILPLKAQEVVTEVPTITGFPYNLQKYTGFNFLADFIAESVIKILIKIKTKTKKVYVDLEIYDGWDLIKKKAKSLNIKVKDLYIKYIPIEYFEFNTNGPIYLKKNNNKQNQTAIPISAFVSIKIDLENVINILNSLPRKEGGLNKIELPIPPFGKTEIALRDLEVKINNKGFVQASSKVLSLVSPDSDPLVMKFTGNLVVKDKKMIIVNLKSEIEDIFTIDSESAKSFSRFLGDLINPVFNFSKYEKNGLTISNIDTIFENNVLVLRFDIKMLPEV